MKVAKVRKFILQILFFTMIVYVQTFAKRFIKRVRSNQQ
jgi:hypothetical protein